jgi:hypothetical protein
MPEHIDTAIETPEASLSTFFAPAGRADLASILEIAREAVGAPLIKIVLEAVSGYLLILDEHRQIVAGNDTLLHALGIRDSNDLCGMRPGELLHCENAHLGPDGCGTSRKCRKCGAVLTILASQTSGQPAEGECSLNMNFDGEMRASEFHVRCTPLLLAGHKLTAFVLQDISSEKRRDVLERVFMHDLKNVLHGLIGYSEVIMGSNPELATQMILALSNQLNEEIDGQDCLMRAERGELDVRYGTVDAEDILEQIRIVFDRHPVSRGKSLRLLCLSLETQFESDPRLLMRILINMVKNAFESVPRSGTIKLRYERIDGAPVFTVWNPGKIPEDVAAQIFQRSFSIRHETGRGLGTYSMRLLGNQYLGGTVTFTTSEEVGTEFTLRLPAGTPVRA